MSHNWVLWLDDLREPYIEANNGRVPTQYALNAKAERDLDRIRWATSSAEASRFVSTYGRPMYMYLDHDLGGEDTAMVFLNWLARASNTINIYVPDYRIISANPIGSKNIDAFMRSWKRSVST